LFAESEHRAFLRASGAEDAWCVLAAMIMVGLIWVRIRAGRAEIVMGRPGEEFAGQLS